MNPTVDAKLRTHFWYLPLRRFTNASHSCIQRVLMNKKRARRNLRKETKRTDEVERREEEGDNCFFDGFLFLRKEEEEEDIGFFGNDSQRKTE
uniref:Uncharacterized protein n=1 Tax=Caenorhabditis tropicalis TaxID=1561998 RepID=A0A1I7TU23_9PELO